MSPNIMLFRNSFFLSYVIPWKGNCRANEKKEFEYKHISIVINGLFMVYVRARKRVKRFIQRQFAMNRYVKKRFTHPWNKLGINLLDNFPIIRRLHRKSNRNRPIAAWRKEYKKKNKIRSPNAHFYTRRNSHLWLYVYSFFDKMPYAQNQTQCDYFPFPLLCHGMLGRPCRCKMYIQSFR